VVLPTRSIARVPSNATDEAATLSKNGLTAHHALEALALRPGQVPAVTGAAGAFGDYVMQLAKAGGLVVVADVSVSDEDLVRDLGADVIVRRGRDVACRIRHHFPAGVDGLADAALVNASPCGRYATVGRWRPCAATKVTGDAALG
jgi:NADPH:quinone reductase